MPELLTAIVGASLGAGVGATVTYLLPRARPLVVVKSVRLSPWISGAGRMVEPSRSLVLDLADFPFDLEAPSPQRLREDQYVAALRHSRRRLVDSSHDVRSTLEVVSQLEDLVAREDITQLRVEYARAQDSLWGAVEAAHLRGEAIEWTNDGDDDQQPADGLRVTHENHSGGCYTVDFPGPAVLHFPYGYRTGPLKARSKELAKRSARAFARGDWRDLRVYFQYVRRRAPATVEAATRLQTAIDQELSKYERIVVEALVANSGRLPYVLNGRATLVIKLQGFPYGELPDGETPAGQGAARPRRVNEDPVLELSLFEANRDEEALSTFWSRWITAYAGRESVRELDESDERRPSAIGVVAGHPHEITCVSDLTLKNMEARDAIRASFHGGEREGEMTFAVIAPGRTRPRPYRVRSFMFAEIEHSPTPDPSRRRLASWRKR